MESEEDAKSDINKNGSTRGLSVDREDNLPGCDGEDVTFARGEKEVASDEGTRGRGQESGQSSAPTAFYQTNFKIHQPR